MNKYQFSGKILCMGSINMDMVMFMEKMPLPGQTLITDNFEMFPGGKGGNQAVAAAHLGAKVDFLGMLGDDELSKQLKESLEKNNVGTKKIMTKEGSTAGIAMIWVDKNGENSITFTPDSQWSVRLDGSNNNYGDVTAGILNQNPTGLPNNGPCPFR